MEVDDSFGAGMGDIGNIGATGMEDLPNLEQVQEIPQIPVQQVPVQVQQVQEPQPTREELLAQRLTHAQWYNAYIGQLQEYGYEALRDCCIELERATLRKLGHMLGEPWQDPHEDVVDASRKKGEKAKKKKQKQQNEWDSIVIPDLYCEQSIQAANDMINAKYVSVNGVRRVPDWWQGVMKVATGGDELSEVDARWLLGTLTAILRTNEVMQKKVVTFCSLWGGIDKVFTVDAFKSKENGLIRAQVANLMDGVLEYKARSKSKCMVDRIREAVSYLARAAFVAGTESSFVKKVDVSKAKLAIYLCRRNFPSAEVCDPKFQWQDLLHE